MLAHCNDEGYLWWSGRLHIGHGVHKEDLVITHLLKRPPNCADSVA
jgi:hypothetical protein